MEDAKSEITSLVTPELSALGFELVEIKLARYGRTSRLQLFIDTETPDGVSIDDCASVSRIVGDLLENKDFFSGPYTLEVSSPGLDRPLKSEKDFRRKIGRTIQVEFNDSSRGVIRGALKDVRGGQLIIASRRAIENVDIADISRAREYI